VPERVSEPMIGVSGENRHGTVDLLGRHDARQLMRPGQGTKGEDEIGRGAEIWIEAVRTADNKAQRGDSLIAAFAEIGGEFGAAQIAAGLIAGDEPAPIRKNATDCLGFVELALLRAPRPALIDLAMLDNKSQISPGRRRALKIALRQIPLRAGLGASDRDEKKTHAIQPVWRSPGRSLPHIFSRL
jgi:hypothetical protein